MSTPSLDAHLEIFAVKRGNRYNDLSDHWFTEKQKEYVANSIINGTVSRKDFIKRHNIVFKDRTIKDWVKTITEGRKIHEFGGRPPSIDEQSKENIAEWTKNGGDTRNPMLSPSLSQLKAKVRKEIKESSKRKGDWTNCDTPDAKTVRKIVTVVGAKIVKGQKTTNARITAVCDPRNFFTFAIMCIVCCAGVDRKLILNWDATTFGVSKDIDDDLVYIKDEQYDSDKPVTGESSGDTCIFVKLYHYHNAQGTIAPPVYVLADDNLSEGAFEVHDVRGLSRHGSDGNGLGYLCFTKTRAANDAFYHWFNDVIVVPFILKIRQDNDMPLVRFRQPCILR